MLKSSTLQHLRFGFGLFLLPVFLFAASQYPISNWQNFVLVFVVLHLFVYPASNGFNSYYDQDEGSIGGVSKPLPVTRELLWTSLLLDLVGLILSIGVNWLFTFMVLIYGSVSKAYSHPLIRLKKYPILSLIILMVFQGIFTYGMVVVGIHGIALPDLLAATYMLPALLSGLLLMGFYPLTQVYQHEEDAARGDLTVSRILGVQGTFWFSAITWTLSIIGFYFYFSFYFDVVVFWGFIGTLLPITAYFVYWFYRVYQYPHEADFTHVHRFILLASSFISCFFIAFYWIWFGL